MVLATMGLVRAPTPEDREAAKLRAIAEEIAKTATGSDDTALADKIRQRPTPWKIPSCRPKRKRSASRTRCARPTRPRKSATTASPEKIKAPASLTRRAGNGSGKSQGKGNSSGSGSGQGKSETGTGQNAGGNNPGSGKGGSGNNSGKNDGGKGSAKNDKNDQNKGDPSNIKLQDELAKAEAQVETANAKNPGPDSKPGDDKNQGGANQPGDKSDQNKSGSQPDPEPTRRPAEARRHRRSQCSLNRRQSEK